VISVPDLIELAQARVEDARVLFAAGRLEGAAYLCGYGVELALKARICKTLNWNDFPETRKEFEGYLSFKTHKLEVLLHLSGAEQEVKTRYLAEWSEVTKWEPESRYSPIGSARREEIKLMIESAESLLKVI
jgi:HEPN domain-containing protein